MLTWLLAAKGMIAMLVLSCAPAGEMRRDRWWSSAWQLAVVFGILAWSFTTLPVAAKYRMSSVPDFLLLETASTILQFAVVAPLVALAWRGPEPARQPA